MAKATVSKDKNVFSTNDPETIQIHIIWRGKLDTFSVAAGKNQILFTVAKLNEVLSKRGRK